MAHFEERTDTYLICPECGGRVSSVERLLKVTAEQEDHLRHCTQCGKYIASTYKEALAELRSH